MAHILHYVESRMDTILPSVSNETQKESDVDRAFSLQRKLDNLHLAYYHDIGKCIIHYLTVLAGIFGEISRLTVDIEKRMV